MKQNYSVLVGFDANVHVDVEAESLQEAMDEAQDRADADLCHQCASHLNVNDQTYTIVTGEDGSMLHTEDLDRAAERDALLDKVATMLKRAKTLDSARKALAKMRSAK